MLTLAIVSFLVVTASTGIGFLAYLYDSRRDRRSLRPDLMEATTWSAAPIASTRGSPTSSPRPDKEREARGSKRSKVHRGVSTRCRPVATMEFVPACQPMCHRSNPR
jgi:hypothetical protein